MQSVIPSQKGKKLGYLNLLAVKFPSYKGLFFNHVSFQIGLKCQLKQE